MSTEKEILFEEIPGKNGSIATITLNRPAKLNSLNDTMVLAIADHLQEWAHASHIKAVLIQAVPGRAFCAGGDLRLTYQHYHAHGPLSEFFQKEYALNRFIFHFPKPYIAFLNGITMGGGAGISINGSHRIATDNLSFAMPETGIGFFPDVGGTYFLSRIKSYIGFYLGLTGSIISGNDCVALGIAQHKLNAEQLPELLARLVDHVFHGDGQQDVTQIINELAVHDVPNQFVAHEKEIAHCFNQVNMEVIVEKLYQSSDALCQAALDTILKKSPTSLKVTLRALHESRLLDFDACMQQEYLLACQFLKGQDFLEGIRAAIIDKDQSPKWQPTTLAEVTQEQIEQYFVKK